MLRKLPLLNLLAILLAVFTVVGITAQGYNSEDHAKAQTPVTPTYTCLGGCTQESANFHPNAAKPGKPKGSITPAVTIPTSPTITTALSPTANASPQPCSNATHSVAQAPGQKHVAGSKSDRGGFLKLFFQVIIAFMKLILDLLGMNGTTNPCAPTPTPTISVMQTPSITPTITIAASATPTIAGTVAGFSYQGGYIYKNKLNPSTGSLSATWNVPNITDCGSLQSSEGQFLPTATIWIGYQVNGKFTKIGTEHDCSQGSEEDKVFTEQYPDPATLYPDDTIAPGDQVTATVTYEGAQKFTVTMNNKTKGWSLSTPITWGTGFDFATAEAVVAIENTGDFNASGTTPPLPEMPLPHFNPTVTFSNVTFSENGKPAQPLNMTTAPGLGLSNNVNREGVKLSDTSAINNDTFTVTWLHN